MIKHKILKPMCAMYLYQSKGVCHCYFRKQELRFIMITVLFRGIDKEIILTGIYLYRYVCISAGWAICGV